MSCSVSSESVVTEFKQRVELEKNVIQKESNSKQQLCHCFFFSFFLLTSNIEIEQSLALLIELQLLF